MDFVAEDLRIDRFGGGGTGAVRVAHIRSGTVVSEDFGGRTGRSSLAATERAIKRLGSLVRPLLHDEGAGL